MVSGKVIRDFYIDAWRRIPALVELLKDQDEGMIHFSRGPAHLSKSLQREVLEMPEGSVFVAYQGFTAGNVRANEITKHQIAAFVRAATPDDDANSQYGALMIDGIPDGEDLPVRRLEADDDVDMMDMPRFERVGSSELPFDIWKLSFAVPEH